MTSTVHARVVDYLGRLYPDLSPSDLHALANRVVQAAGLSEGAADAAAVGGPARLPGHDEVMLITYGDTFLSAGQPHLRTLVEVLQGPMRGVFSAVHLLPFFPSSSDGGFSVVDFRAVDSELGEWSDIETLAGDHRLMVDLVCNHGSAQSESFERFVADLEPHRRWYLTADPTDDLSSVVRPRTHQLLTPVATAAGLRHVWTTFSEDQVDFDFTNPDVLVEFCSILGWYLDRGASRVRLDAIAYLWKTVGTSCIHLPQTHEVVKLFRTVLSLRDPQAVLITETNVPHAENVSYFGDGDEAQLVYNFTLAPLLVWSVLAGSASELGEWLAGLEPPAMGCSFLNFIASHDGLGLRPIEDLIAPAELGVLLDAAERVGGSWSAYATPSGERPYEINVSLADLLAGPDGATADRYVLAHAVLLALAGVPAIYVHSMLATPGDVAAVAKTGHKRDINRARVCADSIDAFDGVGWRADVFERLGDLIRIRRTQSAFAPAAAQRVLPSGPRVLMVERGGGSAGPVLAVFNLSGEPAEVVLPATCSRYDLIARAEIAAPDDRLSLGAYQACWLAEDPGDR